MNIAFALAHEPETLEHVSLALKGFCLGLFRQASVYLAVALHIHMTLCKSTVVRDC